MTGFDKLINSLFAGGAIFNIWLWVKILFLVALGIYIAFGVIVVRQVSLMIKAVDVPMENLLRLIAWLHFLATVGLFLLAAVTL